jgi:two-component system response regulator RegA
MMVAVVDSGVAFKILIVDDDEATRAGLKQLFEGAGYRVTVAGTFAEGRVALSESTPDLLIADVRLGEFNGLHLVATNPRSIPTIIVTGYPDPVLEADAHHFGAEYLLKPVSPAGLMALVKAKLERPKETVPVFSPARRWERKRVSDLPAKIGDAPARILDVSYGGLRFEVERRAERSLPMSLTVTLLTSGLSVPVDLVWTTRSGEEHWLCGAALSQGENDTTTRAWYGLIDAIA